MTRNEIADAVAQRQSELATYGDRVRYLARNLAVYHDDRGLAVDRAFIAARRYLPGGTQRRLRRVAREHWNGVSAAYWQMPLMKRALPPLPDDEFGFVYEARLVEFPHIIKRGISTDVARRERELSRWIKTPVRVTSHRFGTYFDEAMSFVNDRANHIIGEWFFDPAIPIGDMPAYFNKFSVPDWKAAAVRARAYAKASWSAGAVTSAMYAEISA